MLVMMNEYTAMFAGVKSDVTIWAWTGWQKEPKHAAVYVLSAS